MQASEGSGLSRNKKAAFLNISHEKNEISIPKTLGHSSTA